MSRLPNFFAPGEWYHCYSRGIDKRKVFENATDYRRFIELLYLCNTSQSIHRSDLTSYAHTDIFSISREETIASVGAYALLPNHFHLLLYEKEEGGISTFMQKLGTAYTMYFNIKRERSGGLFTKPFRAKHVSEDRYFQHVVDYIHLNPAELFEPKWKEGLVTNMDRFFQKMLTYPYSSLADFEVRQPRPERAILGKEIFDVYRYESARKMLEDAREYYTTTNVKASP